MPASLDRSIKRRKNASYPPQETLLITEISAEINLQAKQLFSKLSNSSTYTFVSLGACYILLTYSVLEMSNYTYRLRRQI
jgi:primosomal protein N'